MFEDAVMRRLEILVKGGIRDGNVVIAFSLMPRSAWVDGSGYKSREQGGIIFDISRCLDWQSFLHLYANCVQCRETVQSSRILIDLTEGFILCSNETRSTSRRNNSSEPTEKR